MNDQSNTIQPMLNVTAAVTGELIASVQLAEFERRPVKVLKQFLVLKTGFGRFQQRLLSQDHREILDEDFLDANSADDLQLVFLPFLAPDEVEDRKLSVACENNDPDAVETILRMPRNPNLCDELGVTALHCAAESGSVACAMWLLEATADVNQPSSQDGSTPLLWAVENGKLDVVRLLIRSRANMEAKKNVTGETALHVAARKGTLDLVRLLVESGADKEMASIHGASPLYLAIANPDVEVAKFLVISKANIHGMFDLDHRTTPLHYAAQSGRLDMAHLLVDYGADKNANGMDGETPLHSAAGEGHVEVARFLIEQQADKDAAAKDGETPLHLAARNGRAKLVRLLLESGADLNVATISKGETPLHCAARGTVYLAVALGYYLKVARFLVEFGAEHKRTTEGKLPLDLAIQYGRREIAQLLQDLPVTKHRRRV